MNELSQKILDAARDEVLRDHKIEMTWEEYIDTFPSSICIPDYLSEAALLAMERQWAFTIWIRKTGNKQIGENEWWNRRIGAKYTTEELYDIWRRDAETH